MAAPKCISMFLKERVTASEKAYRKIGTRDPSGTLAGLYQNRKTGTQRKPENRDLSGALQKPENRDPSGTLQKPENPDPSGP